jgi:hypothetical protein
VAKRFTESNKWADKWFRALRPEFKLAWLYLLDQCDQAGVIDLDCELANFQIGFGVDWVAFANAADGRIESLPNGKIWIVKFVEYQCGFLSRECKAHNPIFASIEKNGLSERVSKGYPKGIQRVQEKEKEKEKEIDKEKEEGGVGETWIVPDRLDSPKVRELLARFAVMRRRIKKPIRDFSNTSMLLDKFDDEDHLVFALETCIANDYQGLKPDYKPSNRNAIAKTRISM